MRASVELTVSRRAAFLLAGLLSTGLSSNLSANPQGMTVVAGSASAQTSGAQLNVTVSQNVFLNWNSFNIAAGETTRFIQPSASSIVLNNIGGASPSKIWGTLNANGTVILANAFGFYFGPNSMIKVGGSFIATTAPLTPDFGAGAGWQFTGLPPLASIVNYGTIEVGRGKSLFLIAEQIENHGTLTAPAGSIGLSAGQEVLLSERPDGRGLSATVRMPSGSVDNTGSIIADAGTIALQAQVVNQNGILQANSVRQHDGDIELFAADELNLGGDSLILARGDDQSSRSPGGSVILKSENNFNDQAGSSILTTGGARGGNGGDVEISARNILSFASSMDARAKTGWTGGRLLLDPLNITLGNSAAFTGSADDGNVLAGDAPDTLQLNVNTAFANKNFSAITLQATANITLAANTVWNLSTSTGVGSGQLTLQAGGDIVFNNGAQIVDANNWSVNLQAGVDFNNNTVQPGVGNIFLNGGSGKNFSGSLSTAQGSINLSAGNSVLVGSGFVRTTAGGSINATALAGDINAGTANGGYQFSIFGYSVSPNLGGISTAAGGGVTLNAGNNIVSTPTVPANQPPGASGAYGSQRGNVTLIAGNQVLGNYLVANGVGTICAGVQVQDGQVSQITSPNADIGSSQRPVSLSLIRGSWNAWAARDIYVAEVRNPNGTFNSSQLNVPAGQFIGNVDNATVPLRTSFLFDYAPDAAANFWAGNSITLAGANLPRVSGQNQNMPPIYAPILNLNAGAGGINVLNSLVLAPSSRGALHITTRAGGTLVGAPQQTTLTGITMSDSGLPGYATFASGHAVTPLHLNDPNPVTLDIAGSVQSLSLTVPTFAHITIGGDTFNFGFAGRNLSPLQITPINVAGNISYRGNLTSEILPAPLPPVIFNPGLSGNAAVALKLRYDAATGSLTFIGQMTAAELAFLLNPTRLVFDQFELPVLDANGNPVTTPVPITAAQQAVIQQLYTDSQSASLGDHGLALAGPGRFDVSAHNIDLGISGGVTVLAPDAALAAISPFGADLNVSASGNLALTSTRIANESYLGGISVNAAGTLDVGNQFTTFGDPNSPKGIFTTSGGNISVLAGGNINLNGSRIAAYNGGNLTVESLNGDVNAGAGGSGYVSLQALELDPVTHQLRAVSASIPGSGLLATTLVGSHASLGNILVETPNGNITANAGGIIQLSFNGTDSSHATTELLAGYELRDTLGQRVAAADLANGTPVFVSDDRDIDAGGSGVIAQNIIVKATGHINGLFVSRGTTTADAGKGFDGPTIFFSSGPPVISGGPGDSGTPPIIISQDPATVNGNPVDQSVPQSNVTREDAKVAEDASTTYAQKDEDETDELKKKQGKGIALAQKTGRVTVIFPPKN